MRQREKYLRSLSPTQQDRILTSIEQLLSGNSAHLDIKQLAGRTNTFRCRVGTIRIIFTINQNKITILYIGPRGDIYK